MMRIEAQAVNLICHMNEEGLNATVGCFELQQQQNAVKHVNFTFVVFFAFFFFFVVVFLFFYMQATRPAKKLSLQI